MKNLILVLAILSTPIMAQRSPQDDNDGCIGLSSARDVLEANLIAEGRYIDQGGVFNDILVRSLDWDDTVGYSAVDYEGDCTVEATISCTGKYYIGYFCEI